MSNPNDPNDPEAGRGKKEDGWKTVVFKSPFAQGNQDPQAAPGQPPPGNYGQPQGGYAPPAPPPVAQTAAPQPPQFPPAPQPPAPAAPSFDKTQVYTRAPFAPPPPASDKTQVYTQTPFPPAPQNPNPAPPVAASQGYPPPPGGGGNFNPPAPAGGGYTPPPPPGGFPPGGARPPQGQPFPQQYGAPPAKKKSKVWLWVLLGILGFILLCVVGCIGFFVFEGKKVLNRPDVAIIALHTRMATHQDAAIFQNADDSWKSSVPRATSDAMFDQVGQQLGTPGNYEIVGTPTELPGDLVQVEVQTTFTQGTATETIVFHKTSLGLKLYHYSIHASGVVTEHERVLNP